MLTVDYTINEVLLYRSIELATELKSDEKMFEELSKIAKSKAELKVLLEAVEKVESEAKGLINSKAKALYGDTWQVIDGNGFKITRSKTGDVYSIVGEPNKKFIKIKKTVDTKEVDNFIAENDKLPAGLELNDKRGESLRIIIK